MLKKAAAMFLLCASMAICVSCANKSNLYVYAALPSPDQISAYREDPNSGVLTILAVSPIAAGQGVTALAIDPSNKFLYAANSFEDDVSVYQISGSGSLTEATSRYPTGTTPTLLVMDKAGQYLYVANAGSNNISSFSIDASKGTLTPVAGSPFPIGTGAINMRVAPSGNFLYVTVGVGGSPGSVEIWTLRAGALQSANIQAVGTNPAGIAIDPSGAHLYTANFGDNSISIFAINSDGSLTPVATVGAGLGILSGPVALLIDSTGKFLYVANETSSTVVAYSIGTDGSLALLPTSYSVATNSTPSSLAIDSAGRYLFVGNNVNPAIESFTRDTVGGVLTVVASYPLNGSIPTSIAVSP
jgi:6-phosphogluconolactonase